MPTKIFIGNLGSNCRSEDLRELFEKYGKVTECDVLKNFGFVVCPLFKNGNCIGLAKKLIIHIMLEYQNPNLQKKNLIL